MSCFSRVSMIFILMIVIGFSGVTVADTTDSEFRLSVKLGDEFYYTRKVPGNDKKSLQYYRRALVLNPRSGMVSWKMARALFSIGRYEPNPDLRVEWLEEGIIHAENAVAWVPKDISAHFWLGATYAQYVRYIGLIKGWRYIFPVKERMEIVLSMDSTFAGAYHILGAWYFTVPFWLGGSQEKGVELLYKAIEYEPNYTLHYIHLVDFLLELKRKTEATQILQLMFQIENPYDLTAAMEDQIYAKQLVEEHQLSISVPKGKIWTP